jgi:thiamine biosynthesis lipoprotein
MSAKRSQPTQRLFFLAGTLCLAVFFITLFLSRSQWLPSLFPTKKETLPLSSEPHLSHTPLFFFGTEISVILLSDTVEQAQTTQAQIRSAFDALNTHLNPWQPGPLQRFNQELQSGDWTEIPPQMAPLIEWSQKLYQASLGRFNPVMGEAVKLWRFHEGVLYPEAPPDLSRREAWKQHIPTLDNIDIDHNRIRSTHSHVHFDFGGVAKGYAADTAIALMEENGISQGVVNLGGDLKVLGTQPDGLPWKIGIRHPLKAGALAWIFPKSHEGVFTSGDYERGFTHGARRYHHIFDPTTGEPSEGLISVTVVDTHGAWADGAATALMAAGLEHWQAVAHALNLTHFMLLTQNGELIYSDALAPQLQIEPDSGYQPRLYLAATRRFSDAPPTPASAPASASE